MDKLTSTITLDNLILRCRLDFTNKIRPLFIKNSCECCGATDNLELHHDKQFIELLDQTLNDLNIDINNIHESDIKVIKTYMLGLQVNSNYTTLCPNCHGQQPHKSCVIERKPNVKVVNRLLNLLDDKYNNQTKFLYDKKTLVVELDSIIKMDSKLNVMINKAGGRNNKPKGLKIYNRFFEDLNFPYRLYSKRKRVRYDEDGNECQKDVAVTIKKQFRWGIFDIRTMDTDTDNKGFA